MACATTVAADVHPHVKQRCAWRPERLTKNIWTENSALRSGGCLTQMGDIPLEIKDWSQV